MKYIVMILSTCFLTGGVMGGCKCQRDVLVEEDVTIDRPTMTQIDPDAERPYTHFDAGFHSDDASLNDFIEKALKTCEEGDYDAFRELFGTSYTPTDQKAFERVWRNVRDIRVGGLKSNINDSEVYYLHATVRLREPDSKERDKRDVVVTIFKEADQWRLGPASKEIVSQVLARYKEEESKQ